jgi:hypothetical protein
MLAPGPRRKVLRELTAVDGIVSAGEGEPDRPSACRQKDPTFLEERQKGSSGSPLSHSLYMCS